MLKHIPLDGGRANTVIIPTTTRKITNNIYESTVKRSRTTVLTVVNNLGTTSNESVIIIIKFAQTELKLNQKMSNKIGKLHCC